MGALASQRTGVWLLAALAAAAGGAAVVSRGPLSTIGLLLAGLTLLALFVIEREEAILVLAAAPFLALPGGGGGIVWLVIIGTIVAAAARINAENAPGRGTAAPLVIALLGVAGASFWAATLRVAPDLGWSISTFESPIDWLIMLLFLAAAVRIARQRGPGGLVGAVAAMSLVSATLFLGRLGLAGNLSSTFSGVDAVAAKDVSTALLDVSVNNVATVMALGVPILFALWLGSRGTARSWLFGLGFLVTAVGLLATISRTSIFAALVGCAVVGALLVRWAGRHRAAAVVVVGGFAALVLAPFVASLTFASSDGNRRTAIWGVTWDFIGASPVLGYGPDAYARIVVEQARIPPGTNPSITHNQGLEALLTGGALTMIPLFVALGALVAMGVVATRRLVAEDERPLAITAAGATGGFAANLASGLFESSGLLFGRQPSSLAVWALAAAIIASYERARPHARVVGEPAANRLRSLAGEPSAPDADSRHAAWTSRTGGAWREPERPPLDGTHGTPR